METLLSERDKFYGLVSVASPDRAVLPSSWPPFPCLIWDAAGDVSQAQKQALARRLIAANCRYVVCAGKDCEEWHDRADAAYLEAEEEPDSDEGFVMTSWHDGESPDDVAFFFVQCTSFDDHAWSKHLAIYIGEEHHLQSELRRMIVSHALLPEAS